VQIADRGGCGDDVLEATFGLRHRSHGGNHTRAQGLRAKPLALNARSSCVSAAWTEGPREIPEAPFARSAGTTAPTRCARTIARTPVDRASASDRDRDKPRSRG